MLKKVLRKLKKIKIFKIIIWWINRKPIPKLRNQYFHLGCGEIDYPGFINVDKRPFRHVHYLSDVERLPFIKDNQADLIYVSHCLEHIPHKKVEKVLNEYYRALKPGGILRISVPDFQKIIKIYEQTECISDILHPLFGGQEYKENFHYITFDFKFLESLLIKSNFKSIRVWNHGDGEYKSLPDWSGKRILINGNEFIISLNVEAVKG